MPGRKSCRGAMENIVQYSSKCIPLSTYIPEIQQFLLNGIRQQGIDTDPDTDTDPEVMAYRGRGRYRGRKQSASNPMVGQIHSFVDRKSRSNRDDFHSELLLGCHRVSGFGCFQQPFSFALIDGPPPFPEGITAFSDNSEYFPKSPTGNRI